MQSKRREETLTTFILEMKRNVFELMKAYVATGNT